MKLEAILTLCAGLIVASCAAAETADDVLERNFAALGGKEKLRAVQTLRLEATQESGGKSVPVKVWWKRPDKIRIQSPFQGLETVQVFDGRQAWYTYPDLPGFETQILTEAEMAALRAQADFVEGPTFDHAAKGHRVELLGKEKLGDGEAWRLLLTTAQGDVRTLWFDVDSNLQVREDRKEFRDGKEVAIESTFSDFRRVGGLLFAHRAEERVLDGGKAGGELSVFSVQKLELNVEVPDALFAQPVPPSAGAAGAAAAGAPSPAV
jgi:outer membrane lipoprotein-sorting protein